MAMASANPERTHGRLLEGYVNQVFAPGVRPMEVTEAYRRMLKEIFTETEKRVIVESSCYDVAIYVALARGFAGSRHRWLQALAMVAAAGSNIVTAKSMRLPAFPEVNRSQLV